MFNKASSARVLKGCSLHPHNENHRTSYKRNVNNCTTFCHTAARAVSPTTILLRSSLPRTCPRLTVQTKHEKVSLPTKVDAPYYSLNAPHVIYLELYDC
ncbi:hypothetical protein J6590_020626 [Homalodisca vitripennis]|nr:hypothetical protein J6590_020626 [Homalodisca vitripennis]